MKHVIVVDGRTATGQLFLHGSNDGVTSNGDLRHPLLDCTAIDLHTPGHICATRELKTPTGSHPQILYLPHGTIVAIFRYDTPERPPLGFAPGI